MKISKIDLRSIILQELNDIFEREAAPQQLGARQKKVATAAGSGASMSPEEYAGMLKQVLFSPKVTTQVRKQSLEALFGQKGTAINSLVLQMMKGAQE